MQLNEAKKRGEQILRHISPYIKRERLAGSIRRKKPIVRDIDIVVELKQDNLDKLKKCLEEIGTIKLKGNKLIRFITIDNMQVDVYIATKENYEPLLLIRTGSKEHNIKLTTKAQSLNYKLTANGLIDNKTCSIIAKSEKDIFKMLKMNYLEPEKRT